MSTAYYEEKLTGLQNIDWDNIEAVKLSCLPVLEELAGDKETLTTFVNNIEQDDRLMEMCEYDAVLLKLVLFDHNGVRLRLHIFREGKTDRAHNHRWTFAARMLTGRYTHVLYQADKELSEDMKYADLVEVYHREETTGGSYALHHSIIHTLIAEADTVSLIIRGPAMKERMIVLDKDTGEAWWQYGAKKDLTKEEKKNNKLTFEEYQSVISFLQNKNLVQ